MSTPACGHAEPVAGRFCSHLMADDDAEHHVRFTGQGTEHDLLCADCADAGASAETLRTVCATCMRERLGRVFDSLGVIGGPEVLSRPTALRFEHREHTLPALAGTSLLALAPFVQQSRPSWLVVDASGGLLRIDLEGGALIRLGTLSAEDVQLSAPLALHVSPCGRFAAVVNVTGRRGVVMALASGAVTMRLDRGGYHEEHCVFSVAFFRDGSRTRVVHATAWNRLDVSDPATGELLTPRDLPPRERDKPAPPHYLDYFHCGLTVSPDGAWLVDDGWVWQPVGVLRSFSLRRWLHENVWESEDGPSLKELRACGYFWDAPRCFVGERILAAWGFGVDEEQMVDAVMLYDVESGKLLRWFAGPPRGALAFDGRFLFASAKGHGTSVWDLETGERLHQAPELLPTAWHPAARCFLTVLGDGVLRESRLLA
ncbi:hypothetical protein HPC49_13270 [Pyxidicoccus fallax]|uniref:Uncharacterized protein n=1 Tax=Pyxidicoccus fallax TaxID=394095 RepID=A0A848LLP5_9BACT|nr:hypothetical protein [Pyxidicoccus fallax]NMO18747.1 hypothetical protein [Pyxidicoccus fallax]NPC79204.1 hypothetical protein [Pyxidicoccus fallax]